MEGGRAGGRLSFQTLRQEARQSPEHTYTRTHTHIRAPTPYTRIHAKTWGHTFYTLSPPPS